MPNLWDPPFVPSMELFTNLLWISACPNSERRPVNRSYELCLTRVILLDFLLGQALFLQRDRSTVHVWHLQPINSATQWISHAHAPVYAPSNLVSIKSCCQGRSAFNACNVHSKFRSSHSVSNCKIENDHKLQCWRCQHYSLLPLTSLHRECDVKV